MKKTVAIFGGSFNPPHIAHVLAATFVLSMEDVDELWVVPCFQHPFAKALAPYEDRYEMCRQAFAWIPRVKVSELEKELGGESRTIRTVQHLLDQHPDWRLRLVIGTDIVSEAPRWHAFDELQRLAPPIVLVRRGWEHPEMAASVFPEVSSTQVRAAIHRGDLEWVRAWVPPAVLRYVTAHGLYEVASEDAC